MKNEKITGLYFKKAKLRLWILYTVRYPEAIDGVSEELYIQILRHLRKNGTRYDLYQLLRR